MITLSKLPFESALNYPHIFPVWTTNSITIISMQKYPQDIATCIWITSLLTNITKEWFNIILLHTYHPLIF